ncbi:hypothetical protein Ahy_B04g069270 isoform D [Arachis hypogaea]|uniref:Uncharacterized protein n=1 Tax=Arachis hypogaea TaxID=3818 RepID=A0A444ZC43_ARAHY|nr:hypothetical protein Ahy_B04g069270 isoform D [Arachis hypogaea]
MSAAWELLQLRDGHARQSYALDPRRSSPIPVCPDLPAPADTLAPCFLLLRSFHAASSSTLKETNKQSDVPRDRNDASLAADVLEEAIGGTGKNLATMAAHELDLALWRGGCGFRVCCFISAVSNANIASFSRHGRLFLLSVY